MNYKNKQLLSRATNYIVKQCPDLNFEIVNHTINHLFSIKDGSYRIESFIIEYQTSGWNDHIFDGCKYSYQYKKLNKRMASIVLPQNDINSIEQTIKILITSSWINTLIKEFKKNANEAYIRMVNNIK